MNLATQLRLPAIRLLILTDMILVAVFATLLLAAAPVLADAMDLPTNLLRGAGAVLVPWAAFLAITWRQPDIPQGAVLTVVVVNIAWVLASLGIVATAAVEPNAFGIMFVLFQSVGVFLLAVGQLANWRTMQ